MSRRAPDERGAALLVTIVSVAVLTALAVDLAYESRVSLRIAANARDELRASYLARSGVALSRLVLSFQQMVDEPTASLGASVPVPRFNIWRMVPVGSGLAAGLFPGGPAPDAEVATSSGTSPSTGFDAVIDDEGRKVNAQLDALAGLAPSQVLALYQLVCDARWDPLFDREDANGVRTSREDLLVRLKDWIDGGDVSSGLKASFGGANCSMVPGQPPFEDAFGDENQPYDRGEDRYRTKNARMDSLDELYLIAGVGDAFMAAFGDALTVYLPPNAKMNVNELDRAKLVLLATLVATDPLRQPALLDPAFADRLQKLLMVQTFGGILSVSPTDFGRLVAGAGVQVNQNLLTGQNSPFTDRSSTFRIRSTGKAGDVSASIDAVVWIEKAEPNVAVAAPGKLVHWREE